MVGGQPLHFPLQLSFLGPSSVELASLWEEIDVEFSAGRVADEMPSVDWEGEASHDCSPRC
jgi:hypothetical protein